MKPDKLTVVELFQRERRFCIPLFQRAYVWRREDQWEPLWDDVRRQAEGHLAATGDYPVRTHFLGAIVWSIANVQGRSVARADVIDGQQRLTTLQLLLGALRDAMAIRPADPEDADMVRRLTANPIRDQSSDELFKVWPTNSDREPFRTVMRAGSAGAVKAATAGQTNRMAEAYAFFHEAILAFVDETADDDGRRDRFYAMRQALQTSLQVVVIELEAGDDPQVIFETLNARGQPLLPSDLIRNFVFLNAPSRAEGAAERLYETYWKPFDEDPAEPDGSGERRFSHQEERQGRLRRPRIDLFIFHYLTMRTERDIRIGHLFQEFRTWRAEQTDGIEEFLADLARHARLYKGLVTPGGDDRLALLAERLRSLDTSTVHPLLLFLAGLDGTILPAVDRDRIAVDLESYLVRRFVCWLPANNYNRFFLALLGKAKQAARDGRPIADAVREELARSTEPTSVWPDDDAFARGWAEKPVYVQSRSDRSAMILKALEAASRTGRNERVSFERLTVEHLLPQKASIADYPFGTTEALREGQTPEERRRDAIHTIGNLTLLTQQLNSSVGNGPWPAKRKAIVIDSDLRLNAWMRADERASWSDDDIAARATELFATAAKVWPSPPKAGERPISGSTPAQS